MQDSILIIARDVNKNNASDEFYTPNSDAGIATQANADPIWPYSGQTDSFFSVATYRNTQAQGDQIHALAKDDTTVGSAITVGAGLTGLFTTNDVSTNWNGTSHVLNFTVVGSTGDTNVYAFQMMVRFFPG